MDNFLRANDLIQNTFICNVMNVDETEADTRAAFARATVTDYGAVLANAVAYGASPHRIRRAKLQEMSGRAPQYSCAQCDSD